MKIASTKSSRSNKSDINIPDYLKPILHWSRLVNWTPGDFQGYVLRRNNEPVLNTEQKRKINHTVGRIYDRAIDTRRNGGLPGTPELSRTFDIRDHIKAVSDTVRIRLLALCSLLYFAIDIFTLTHHAFTVTSNNRQNLFQRLIITPSFN